MTDSKAVGYVEYNDQTDGHDIIIDGRRFTAEQFQKNLAGHEGFQIKIEFADDTNGFEQKK